MHSLHFVYRGFKCTHTSTNAYSLLRLQTNQCTDYQCSRDRYTAKGQLTEQLTQKQTCIYAHTHPKVIQYTDKSDRPACQSSSLLHDDGLVQRSGPHTISQREEKQPSSILIFFLPHLYSYPHSYSSAATPSRLGSFVCISADHCLRWRRGGGLSRGLADIHTTLCVCRLQVLPPDKKPDETFFGILLVYAHNLHIKLHQFVSSSHCLIIFKVSNVF